MHCVCFGNLNKWDTFKLAGSDGQYIKIGSATCLDENGNVLNGVQLTAEVMVD